MPKRCGECNSVTGDEIGYCPACGCTLGDKAVSLFKQLLQYMAVVVATGSIAASILYYLQSHTR